MALDRTAFNALLDDSGTGTDGSVVDKDTIEAAILDPVDAEIARIDADIAASAPTLAYCVAYHNTTEAVTADAALSLNSEDADVGSMHDLVTNNSRVTIPAGQGGLYLAFIHLLVDTENAGDANPSIRKNGSTKLVETKLDSTINVPFDAHPLQWVGVLADGDYLEIFIDKSSADSWTFGSSSRARATTLTVVRLR